MKQATKVIALAPLCENMPSGRATKPGDVFRAMDGTTVAIDNTDAEGRLLLGISSPLVPFFERNCAV